MNAIIFSKNRAMQLDCLLRSIEKNMPFVNPVIIYKNTSAFYSAGYNKIQTRWLLKEKNLKKDILDFMTTEYTCFLVDDDIVFDNVNRIPKLNKNQTYSIRLGPNIKNKKHLNYPFSLDGNFFLTYNIKPLIKSIDFSNPNKLESMLHHRFSKNWHTIYNKQRLVGICHNRVSNTSHCSFTGKYSEENLNQMFIDGQVIDFENMDFSNINNVHSEIDYKFKKCS